MTIEISEKQYQQRWQQVMDEIKAASQSADRTDAPQLLAVSKTQTPAAIEAMIACGQRAFGENYLQEALEKQASLAQSCDLSDALVWHYIGHIQSNKTADIAANFAWVQTIDRFKIARRLSEQRPDGMPDINICIQVNISDESSKSGVTVDDLMPLAEQIVELPRLTLRGLMTIPAIDETADQVNLRQDFERMQTLYVTMQQKFPSVDTLSMGMTADMQLAIAHGSTMLRVGTALFGPRDKTA